MTELVMWAVLGGIVLMLLGLVLTLLSVPALLVVTTINEYLAIMRRGKR